MRLRLVIVGVGFVLAGVAGLVELAILYSPFQPAVLVVSPFLVVGVLVSIGASCLVIALFAPETAHAAKVESSFPWPAGVSAAALGLAVLALAIAVVLPGPPGPSGSDRAFVSGTATVIDCSFSPSVTTFRISYTNYGNAPALNVVAQFVVYALNNPVVSFSGTVSLGSVQGKTTSTTTQSASVGCGFYGTNAEVSFTWT